MRRPVPVCRPVSRPTDRRARRAVRSTGRQPVANRAPTGGAPGRRKVTPVGVRPADRFGPADMASPINFNQFLEKEKLKSNGSNFTDWFRHVRIFLNGGNLQYVLDAPLGDPPAETETDEVKNVYATRKTRYSQVQCAILCSLESDLQKRFEHHDPHELMKELKTIFETHAAVECYEASKHFFSCMMEEGSSISEHMLVMTGHAKKLSDLGIVIPNRLGINRVLQSLPPSYKNFVMNYNMQNMNKEFPELFGMLKAAEIEIKKEHQVLMVNKTTSFKKQGKSKGKFKKGGKKAATPPMKPKNGPKPDAECYYCKRRDTGSELKNKRQLLKDEVTMRVGNGSKVNVIAVGTLPLHLPSGLVLSLNNCYYVPALSMNIISGSCLICEACLMGKMTKTPFSGMMERATDLLEIIHTDVCGPMSVASRGGYRYVLTFTDDLSRYGYIYLMKHKSETFEKFKEFQSEVENQRNKKIKFLRSDRGGEYLSYEFGMHLKKCGILSQLTPPGTPQRNGVSERRNRTLLDMVRSMMSLTDLPLSFWSYALETAAFTLNRAPSKSVETTPYELWFNKKPKLSFLKVWGCEAYVKKLQPDKLEPKAEKCVFIGYPKETIGYTFYHRSEGKIFVAKNGTFLEKEFLTKESSAVPENVPVPPTPTTEEANDNDHETSYETATEPRRSTRDRATPDWYDPCLNVMIVDNNDEDPATYEEAMMSPDSNKWQEAMKSEMGSMYDNKVWTLVDLPDSRKAVENKWIFKRKTDADGMEHWTAVKNILKYLKRTKDMFLCYGGDQELVVTSYTDASWNTDPDDSKSQSGYVFILNGAAVSWASSKQCTVAKSSTESEYIAASSGSVPDVIPDITRSSGMVRRIRFIYRMSFYVNKMMRKVLWKVLEGSRKVRKKPPRKVESTWDSTSMAGNPSGEESQVDSPLGGHPLWKVEFPPLVGILAWEGFPPYGRKVILQIFSELDETKAHGLFSTESSRSPKRSGAHTIWRRGWPPGRADLWGGSPLAPPTLPLRLYIAPDAKTLKQSVIFHQGFRSAAAIDDKFRGTESLFRHAAGRGIAPGAISIDSIAIFIADADSHDEERVVLPRGCTGSYVVHLSPMV
ncbi:hypothetical protein QYE76_023943 [Lolium multiflorum]|uniref:Integrase catalytic domain-containing protein n=1 Tax=Lolium multiflorum TaxID=4521 RepID=A0AAD8VUL6_LOLMU|nr:hypothetical protein QYE76_023943 [Lolium multiflorum]